MSDFLADTTILVDHLRYKPYAKNLLESLHPAISSVTIAELYQGSKNKQELRRARKLISGLTQIEITENICKRSLKLVETFYLSHGCEFLDALIASTAIEYKRTLITENIKHFSFIKELILTRPSDFE